MTDAFAATFRSLREVLRVPAQQLWVRNDDPGKYTLIGRIPSPLKQHKGQPMWFAEVRAGKAYVSLHLMPLYMNDTLAATISPALKKRMQGKTCFNFKAPPAQELIEELERLTAAGWMDFQEKGWV